ncbi:thioredoxin family protein [Geodermatophilus marinus]|uniref:thioredoxin family protein n=1 Tax=Geodermatophilus sp. LHW52908 TaxID=2303986 RepID=UPI000E3EB8E1|nr:thioredoxin family protein [Geodermatophilus sp. LHW52908]RFU20858.1 thioredoxin [Geodermatophilus sp. LHW52908]
MEPRQSLLAALREAIRGPGWAPGRHLVEGGMPSLDGATGWLNSPPLTTEGLRGRVVAVDFWTYTCINWLRTAPYRRAWHESYRDSGLVVLGVHTPEFAFERDVGNVRRAVEDLRIRHPVAVDSDYAVWTAFANMYWPALYLVDAQGKIRFTHAGEGAYEESEGVIRQLLSEVGADGTLPGPVGDERDVEGRGVEAAADRAHLASGETYLGADRTEHFASPERLAVGSSRRYTAPSRLPAEHWALTGGWTVQPDAVLLDEPGGRIRVRFTARDLHLVMAPAVTVPVPFRVLLDGRPPGADHGEDVDDDGAGTLTEPRLHQLVRQRRPVVERTFEIGFADPGVRAFAVTFG